MTPIVLLMAVCAALLIGATGGHALATFRSAVPPLPLFDLSDEAIAHIAYEIRRSYERSLGIIRLKAWNNLSEAERGAKTNRVRLLREGKEVYSSTRNFVHRAELAILALVPKRS